MTARTGRTRTWGPGWGIVRWWLIAASLVLLLQSWLFEASFLFSLISLPVLLLVAIVLLVVLLAMRAWGATLAFVAATVLLPILPLNMLGHQVWTRISFMQHRAAYEEIVARAPVLPVRGTVDGVSYIKDGGRIVFPRSHGMPDGWSGVVHDPADTLPLTDQARSRAFGSYIQSCIRIERGWYRCWLD